MLATFLWPVGLNKNGSIMIAFPRVRSMFIYIYIYNYIYLYSCVTYASMRCIRS